MQLSTSTFPLDPALAAVPAANLPSGLGAAGDSDTPAFSSLLSSERQAAGETVALPPAPPLFGPSTGGEPAPASGREQEAIAAWLAANGFPPPAAPIAIVSPELLGAEPAVPVDPSTPAEGTTVAGFGEAVEGANAGSQEAVTGDRVRRTRLAGEETGVAAAERPRVFVSERVLRASPAVAASPDAIDAAGAQAAQAGDAALAAERAGVTPSAPVADAAPEKTRARAAASAADAAIARGNPFAFARADRVMSAAVSDARAMIAQAASPHAEAVGSTAEAASPSDDAAMTALASETLPSPAMPRAERGRPDPRTYAAHDAVAAPAATVELPTTLRVNRGTEKFAVPGDNPGGEPSPDNSDAEKKSLNFVVKEVTGHSPAFGINAAKTEAFMPATATSAASSSSTVELERVSPVSGTFETLFTETEQAVPTLVQAARRSVESALAVAEQFATGDKRAVMLQFSVSGVDLGVRVELRGDGVHTTFRTDSPELRAALAQEWQTVAGGQGSERSARFADPVFTSASQGNAQHGDGSADQRGSHPRQDRQMSEDLAALNVAPRIKSPLAAAPAPAARAAAVSTSTRLHTFA